MRVSPAYLLLAILMWAAPGMAQGRSKVILDTDIGTDIDDAWALAYALASADTFELIGVTIADGDTPARAKIACKMLHRARRGDIPVAVGRATAVPPERVDHQFTWAEDFTDLRPTARPAADFIVETAKQHPGQVTLIAVGPLQNVADALRKEPQLGKYLKRVVLMSGNIHSSTWQPWPIAEWNVVSATADAQLVYAAGLPLSIVPLDATTHVVLETPERDRMRRRGTPLLNALESLYRLWLSRPDAKMTLHDQLAVAEAARPDAFFLKKEVLKLIVDDKGFTRIDPERGTPVTVCFWPKRKEFMEHFIGVLTK